MTDTDNRIHFLAACSALYDQLPQEVVDNFTAIVTKLLQAVDKEINNTKKEDREKVAKAMITLGIATGHGDTIDDLLGEWSREYTRIKLNPNTNLAPDYIYDPDNWEVTIPYDNRHDLIENLEIRYEENVKQLETLIHGPSRYVVPIVQSWDDTGDPDEIEVQWFDTEEEAKTALAASLAKKSTSPHSQ